MQTIRTTCPYCGVGCGVLASVDDAGQVSVRGDDQHPANLGRLCVKGAALGETTGLAGRLLAPEVDGQQVARPQALAETAARACNRLSTSTARRRWPSTPLASC